MFFFLNLGKANIKIKPNHAHNFHLHKAFNGFRSWNLKIPLSDLLK